MMFKVLKAIWKGISFIRVAILNVMFIGLILIVVVAINDSVEQQPVLTKNAPLLIAPTGRLVDKKTIDSSPLALLNDPNQADVETEVRALTTAIRAAKHDPNVTAIILKLDQLYSGGISKLEEVGQAIEFFKTSNKPVIAYSDSYSQQQYYLASYADTIYLHDMGTVFINGYGVYQNYIKDAVDKLNIKFHVFRVGEYKDAIENFVRNDMSEQSREHTTRWVNELWGRYTSKVEQLRDLPAGAVESYILSLANTDTVSNIENANIALDAGLVDKVLTQTQLRSELESLFGKSDDHAFKHIRLKDYLAKINRQPNNNQGGKIGLIVAQGTIIDGRATEDSIGADSLISLIRQANEKELDALVIRINSGGGSAFASELIRDQLIETQNSGLPIYISMGSIAASGGYWLSMPATEIWATPSTITGSIGVWGLIPNVTDSLASLGIHSDGVGTSPLADIMHPDREMSAEAKTFFQRNVNNIYTRFLDIVSEARNATPDDIHKVAQGKIWTGETALELGLVDHLGSLHDVTESVATSLGLDHYQLVEVERELSPKEQLIRSLIQETQLLTNEVGAMIFGLDREFLEAINSIAKAAPLDALKAPSIGKPTIFTHCQECVELN